MVESEARPPLILFDSATEVRRLDGHVTVRLKARNAITGTIEPVADIRCPDRTAESLRDVLCVTIRPPV